jgi:hypothetical protein
LTAGPPEIIYHYTNSAGLLGILSGGQLWLGDVEFMNDAEELLYGRAAVVADLEAKAESLWPANVEDPDQSAEWCRASIIRLIVNFLTRVNLARNFTYHVYASCFCEDPDLLSQWRGYAGEGGYAVGFRADALAQIVGLRDDNIFSGQLARVRYGLDAARTAINELVDNTAPYAQGHWPTAAYHQFMQIVLPVVATIKHPSFAEEKEWRILQFSWGLAQDVAFRSSRTSILPYRCVELPEGAIASVMIGPGYHPDVRKAGVLQLLDRLGLQEVDVRASASPLRP